MIDKVSGIQATCISLNDRFSLLAEGKAFSESPTSWQAPRTPRFFTQGIPPHMFRKGQAYKNALARRIDRQFKIAALRERLGLPQPLYRRYGNQRRGMRRSNSFGDLSQASFGNYSQASFGRRSYNSFGGLSRSASFDNLSQVGRGGWRRGFRRQQPNHWRFKQFGGNRQWQFRGQRRGRGNMGGGNQRNRQQQRLQKPVPTKEELDHQLEVYMSSSKHVLDQQLEEYMKMADMAVADN